MPDSGPYPLTETGTCNKGGQTRHRPSSVLFSLHRFISGTPKGTCPYCFDSGKSLVQTQAAGKNDDDFDNAPKEGHIDAPDQGHGEVEAQQGNRQAPQGIGQDLIGIEPGTPLYRTAHNGTQKEKETGGAKKELRISPCKKAVYGNHRSVYGHAGARKAARKPASREQAVRSRICSLF